jgi:DNA-binding transcriptional ArsR family regulator
LITYRRTVNVGWVVPDALLEEVARRFALLGDPTRLRLLKALQEGRELSVGNLAAASGVARVNVSQHLNRLALAGLVSRRREGTTIFYRVSDPSLNQLCDLVCAGVLQRARALTSA